MPTRTSHHAAPARRRVGALALFLALASLLVLAPGAPAGAQSAQQQAPPVPGQLEPHNVQVVPGDGTLTVTWEVSPRAGFADDDIRHALRWSQVSGVWANPKDPRAGGAEDGISVDGGVASYTITGLDNGIATGVFVRSFTGNSHSERAAGSSRWVRTKGAHTTPTPGALTIIEEQPVPQAQTPPERQAQPQTQTQTGTVIETVIWESTIKNSAFAGTDEGCDDGSNGDRCSDAGVMSNNQFTFGGTTYTVTALYFLYSSDYVEFSLTSSAPWPTTLDKAVLYVGSEKVPSRGPDHQYSAYGSGRRSKYFDPYAGRLSTNSGTTTTIKLAVPSVPPNIRLGPGDEMLTLTWDAPSFAVSGAALRWRVKDADSNSAGDQPGSWLPASTGAAVPSAAIHARMASIPPRTGCDTCAALMNGTEYEVEARFQDSGTGTTGWVPAGEGTPQARGPVVVLSKIHGVPGSVSANGRLMDLPVTEGGDSSFVVALDSSPGNGVVVTVELVLSPTEPCGDGRSFSCGTGDTSLSIPTAQASLTFSGTSTASNAWSAPQIVRVDAADNDRVGDEYAVVLLLAEVTTGTATISPEVAGVRVTMCDNDGNTECPGGGGSSGTGGDTGALARPQDQGQPPQQGNSQQQAPPGQQQQQEAGPPTPGQLEPYNVQVTPGDGTLTVTWSVAPRDGFADDDIRHALRWSQVSGVWANPADPLVPGRNDGITVDGGVATYTITGLQNGVATGVFVRSYVGHNHTERGPGSSKWVRTKGDHTTPRAAE